jgi:peptidyl-prolyl cis-trans isomerase SurA
MKYKNIRLFNFRFVYISVLLLTVAGLHAQEQVVDRIVAVIGQNMVLESEIEAQYLQAKMQGTIEGSAQTVKCQILENMILENIMLNQAELDSVQVTDSEVEQSLDQRLRYFISQFGSKEKLEEYYGKSVVEIKEEFRTMVKNNLLVQQVQVNITKNVFVTPNDVKVFYRSMPTDSIPLINAKVEMKQIIKVPPVSMEQKVMIKEELRDLRRRVLEGENFATLAILYSEDPGSAAKGGEIGFFGRGELYPEYEAAAYKLKEGEISEIIESKAGFHIIQLIERKGDYINTRHILLMTKPSPVDMENARIKLDSVLVQIQKGEITFEQAALKYSDDPGKYSGGYIINPYPGEQSPNGGTTWFEMDELEPQVSFIINKLDVGQISSPVPTTTEDGKDAFRLVKLQSRIEPHRANLNDDYSFLQELALQQKKQEKLVEWVNKNADNAYIMVIDDYKTCEFNYNFFPANN